MNQFFFSNAALLVIGADGTADEFALGVMNPDLGGAVVFVVDGDGAATALAIRRPVC
ncbi:hypothetical protein [Alloacidobacterium sp.]|uniref:hypothetical protein n=1 Tax=Alloacidobacterium sp. TaxID=2951999 RepID=UPI002D6D5ECC|nr:hypothetical protein [Alloacidobacterium sp.]HYK36099.1 hypothetical protein [Alloacidobacterium sp.]